jgi:hypothetical protein
MDTASYLPKRGFWMYYRQPCLLVLHVLQSGVVHSCGESFSVSSRPPIVNQRNEILPLYLTFEPQYFRAFTAPRTYVPGVIVARFQGDVEILFRSFRRMTCCLYAAFQFNLVLGAVQRVSTLLVSFLFRAVFGPRLEGTDLSPYPSDNGRKSRFFSIRFNEV